MVTTQTQPLKVAVGGFGAIGYTVAARLDRGIEGLVLAAVAAREAESARARMAQFRNPVPVVGLGELAELADVVVECAPSAVFLECARAAINRSRIFMPLSAGMLIEHDELIAHAKETGARIIVPSGALLGLDALRAAAEGTIHSVSMVTRKPPTSLVGAPYLYECGISLEGLTEPLQLYEGSAREGIEGFPANVNVAAALSLAGIGPDRTHLEIWADPAVTRNTHYIEVEADSARFALRIENIPTEENPRTGRITALSVISTLRGLTATLKIGT